MRVHLPALPHTDTVRVKFDHCAFTKKCLHLATMLTSLGHHVVLYGSERNEADCAEHVVCVTDAMRDDWFGGPWPEDRVFDRWDAADPCWAESDTAVIKAIAERLEPGDTIAIPIGTVQVAIVDAFPGVVAWESGVGYLGSWLPFRVFESHAWQHWTYGAQNIHDGRYYDTVIPNAVDPTDFTFRADHDGYLLFLGRHTERKGLAVVAELAKHHPVVSAGQGNPIPGVQHLGVVKGRERAALLAGARAVLAPTLYLEPFGGVAVEAQVSGTPVIASPFGAFTETVEPGVSGFLPHTLSELLAAVEACDTLDPYTIRQRAVERFSVDAVAPQYDTYLHRLETLHGEGWYQL